METKKLGITLTLICLMFTIILNVPTVSAQNGPKIDLLRFKAFDNSPASILDAQLQAMLDGTVDSYASLIRTSDIETLDSQSFTITSAPGYHIAYIGYNIRDTATIQSYYRPEITYWPLHDVEFRDALFHCHNQLAAVQNVYGYTVTPIHSLVPPAQSKYYNPNVQQHQYNPGNPFTSPAGEHTSCGILKAAGYTFVDTDNSGTVTNSDYWKCPDGSPVPKITIWTPIWPCGTTNPYVQYFINSLRDVGLLATGTNDYHGIMHFPREYYEYLVDVFGTSTGPGGKFDAFFIAGASLREFPDHLYPLCHSSYDSYDPIIFGSWGNGPGIINPTIDELVETVRFSLNPNAIEAAAKQVQEMLYDPTLPDADNFALAYMMMYSRTYFNSYDPNLRGVVNSAGYGSENTWTYLNLEWLIGFERTVDSKLAAITILDDPPRSFNPLTSVRTWTVLNGIYDSLINSNPYNHYDVPWIATSWTITETVAGMNIDFTIRSDVEWQDGKLVTAYDIEWCLEFIRNQQIPRYFSAWDPLTDVVVTDNTHFTIQCSEAGLGLFYDLCDVGLLLPQHIWNRSWTTTQDILAYDPTEPYNVAPGYTPGSNPPPTNLFGTGPWAFQQYNTMDLECDLQANRNYFKTQADVQTLLSDMFWETGDQNRDGIVNITDLVFTSLSYGSVTGDPTYNPNVDFNSDGIIDMRDMRTAAFHLAQKKENP